MERHLPKRLILNIIRKLIRQMLLTHLRETKPKAEVQDLRLLSASGSRRPAAPPPCARPPRGAAARPRPPSPRARPPPAAASSSAGAPPGSASTPPGASGSPRPRERRRPAPGGPPRALRTVRSEDLGRLAARPASSRASSGPSPRDRKAAAVTRSLQSPRLSRTWFPRTLSPQPRRRTACLGAGGVGGGGWPPG